MRIGRRKLCFDMLFDKIKSMKASDAVMMAVHFFMVLFSIAIILMALNTIYHATFKEAVSKEIAPT